LLNAGVFCNNLFMLISHHLSSHRNNFAVLRLLAALLVLYGHCYPLVLATPALPHVPDPLSRAVYPYLGFGQSLSGIGLCLFFFISGLLVSKSYLQRGNALTFIRSRAVRIYPGLAVNLLFCTLIVGAYATTLPLPAYLFHSGIHDFIIHNLILWETQFELPGVFQTLPWHSVNGSLWTLPLEIRMYGWCLVFGALGILQQRAMFNTLFLVAIGLFLMQGKSFLLSQPNTDFLWIYFLLGMFCTLNAAQLRLDARILAGLILFTACLHGAEAGEPRLYNLCFAITVSYAILCAAYLRYIPQLDIGRIGDFSYGIYLYAYPLQQLIVQHTQGQISPLMLCFVATLLTLPLAVLSWYTIEKPALKRFRP
jgi:peptidoglycan/LPS O-acetylase OafA/YrhL